MLGIVATHKSSGLFVRILTIQTRDFENFEWRARDLCWAL